MHLGGSSSNMNANPLYEDSKLIYEYTFHLLFVHHPDNDQFILRSIHKRQNYQCNSILIHSVVDTLRSKFVALRKISNNIVEKPSKFSPDTA